jgi:hypothetical protein
VTNEVPAVAEVVTNEVPAVTEAVTNAVPAVAEAVTNTVPAAATIVNVATNAQPKAASVTPKPTPPVTATIVSKPPAKVAPTNQLVTLSGDIYNNVYVEKVQSDGIIISYTPKRGGIAMIKIYLYELSDQSQRRFGFNPASR